MTHRANTGFLTLLLQSFGCEHIHLYTFTGALAVGWALVPS